VLKKHRICVVVPSYNEEGHVGLVIKTMPEFVDHIVVVDDGSLDKTSEKAAENSDERVVILRHQENQGVGGAIVTGHKKAIEVGAEISVVMGGDGQMDPRYLTNLLNAITEQRYDYAKGNRFLKRGHTQGMPRIRVVGNILLSFLTKFASGYWNISDPQNGYTAIRTSILKELDLDHLARGYQFENDMLIHLNLANARVKDVQIPAAYYGQPSKIKIYKFIPETSLFLVKRFFYRIYKKHISRD
jgi:glycosyltransferase involved in cell wall biosynthesis